MKKFEILKERFTRFLRDEEGATAVEYAVMLALIIVVAILAVKFLGEETRDTFNYVGNTLKGARP